MSSLKLLIAVLLLTPAAAVAQECPRIEVLCPTEMSEQGMPMTFSASVSGGDPNAQFTFNWTVSAGTITSGQGTPSVTLDTTGLGGQIVKVTVEVGGLPQSCASSGTCEAKVASPPIACWRPLDEYGENGYRHEPARLDNFAIALQFDPPSKGLIIVYAGRRARPGEAMKRGRRALSYLTNKRGIDAERLTLVDGGYRSEATTQLWVVPPGAAMPPPMLTIDPGEVEIIRGKGKKVRRRSQ